MILPLLAPILATLAANGLGVVADAVTKKGKEFVEDKLGVELTPDPSPEAVENWKIAAQQHERELLQMAYGDVANARSREVDINSSAHASWLSKNILPLLAATCVVFTFMLYAMVMFVPDPVEPSRKDLVIYVLGALTAISTQIIAYYFGSSKGSADKSDELNVLLGGKK